MTGTTQTTAWKTETEAAQNTWAAFVKLDLPGYTARFFSGIGVINHDMGDGDGAQDWTGAGSLGFVGPIEGSTEVEAGRFQLGLSGLDSNLKAELVDYLVRGSEVYVWLAYLDSDGALVEDPWLAFFGKIDVPEISEGAESVEVIVECSDGVSSFWRRTTRYRNTTDQEDIFSGDVFYEFVTDLRAPIPWGQPGGGGGGGNGGFGARGGPGSGGYWNPYVAVGQA